MTISFASSRAVRHIGIAALFALGCVAAQATVVSRNFSVTIDPNTSLISGQTFSGSFSFDDSIGTVFGTDTLYALTNFSFDFNGGSFSLADLDLGHAAVFDGSNMFTGLDATSFANGFGFVPGTFSYDLGQSNAGFGTFSSNVNTAVPEPGTGALALAALGLLAWNRRRVSRTSLGV